jgi:hypothetical protein
MLWTTWGDGGVSLWTSVNLPVKFLVTRYIARGRTRDDAAIACGRAIGRRGGGPGRCTARSSGLSGRGVARGLGVSGGLAFLLGRWFLGRGLEGGDVEFRTTADETVGVVEVVRGG